jgi:hypothetical protein
MNARTFVVAEQYEWVKAIVKDRHLNPHAAFTLTVTPMSIDLVLRGTRVNDNDTIYIDMHKPELKHKDFWIDVQMWLDRNGVTQDDPRLHLLY